MSVNKNKINESKKLTELRQLVSHFNNCLANLKSRFAILDSMNDKSLISKINKKESANTYQTIQHSLLLTCTIDIANLGKDNDKRSLSLVNIMKLINDEEIKIELLNIRRNTRREISFISYKPPKEFVEELYAEQTAKSVDIFEGSLKKLIAMYGNPEIKQKLDKFWTVRSKIAAHKDIFNKNGELLLFSDSQVDINFKDIEQLVSDLEEFNNLFHTVVEAFEVGWESYDLEVKKSISNFWKPFY